MSRSNWKGPFIDYSLAEQYKSFVKNKSTNKYTFNVNSQSRNSTILPQFVGFKLNIYNGKTYVPLVISEEMVGHKLGEFVPTRVHYKFKKNKN